MPLTNDTISADISLFDSSSSSQLEHGLGLSVRSGAPAVRALCPASRSAAAAAATVAAAALADAALADAAAWCCRSCCYYTETMSRVLADIHVKVRGLSVAAHYS